MPRPADASPVRQIVLSEAAMDGFMKEHRDIGDVAVWRVSSAKYGNGVHQLRDGTLHTFWQSDGMLPHVIRCEFPALTPVDGVAVYLSYQDDESYTPTKLAIRMGTHENDLVDVATVDLDKPNGWVISFLFEEPAPVAPSSLSTVSPTPVTSGPESGADDNTRPQGGPRGSGGSQFPLDPSSQRLFGASQSLKQPSPSLPHSLYGTTIDIMVQENHQQGRDTHIRGVKILQSLQHQQSSSHQSRFTNKVVVVDELR